MEAHHVGDQVDIQEPQGVEDHNYKELLLVGVQVDHKGDDHRIEDQDQVGEEHSVDQELGRDRDLVLLQIQVVEAPLLQEEDPLDRLEAQSLRYSFCSDIND